MARPFVLLVEGSVVGDSPVWGYDPLVSYSRSKTLAARSGAQLVKFTYVAYPTGYVLLLTPCRNGKRQEGHQLLGSLCGLLLAQKKARAKWTQHAIACSGPENDTLTEFAQCLGVLGTSVPDSTFKQVRKMQPWFEQNIWPGIQGFQGYIGAINNQDGKKYFFCEDILAS